jgi:hypothetical protein
LGALRALLLFSPIDEATMMPEYFARNILTGKDVSL